MNKVALIGRLARDPELRYTQNGTAVSNFTLAVNRPFAKEGEQSADFINIVAWGKIGENSAKYLAKGRQAAIEGRIQVRSYDDKDGQKRYITEVVAERVEFIGGAKKSESGDEDDFGTEVEFDEADIPF